MEYKDGDLLKDERLRDSVSVFEEYCNAGLYMIEMWLDDNPGDPSGVDTLLKKIYERIVANEQDFPVNNEEIEVLI